MRIWLSLVLVTGMLCAVAHADTIKLKNGNTIEGKVLEKMADGIKVDVGGVTLTYYSDEIESVVPAEGAAPVVEVKAPEVVPVPAVPEVAAAPVAVQAPAVPDVAVVPVAPAPAVAAAVDELSSLSKEDLIKKFVEVYGVKENMQANFDQMTSTLKPEQGDAFRQSVKVDEIVELLLPIYDKHFEADDLRAYIRFYSSAEGKKLTKTLPLLMKDSVDISMKYLDTHLPESLKQEQPAAPAK